MRYLIVLVFILAGVEGFPQITIHGQIANYDGKSKVYYTPTLEGISFTEYEITPNPNGSFKIKYYNEGYGTCRVNFSRISFSFIHASKAEISFSIDQSKITLPRKYNLNRADHIRDSVKQAATIYIRGDLADFNRFNNITIRSSTRVFTVEGCDYSQLVKEAETPEEVVHLIDSLLQREFDQISRLESTPGLEAMNVLHLGPDIKKLLINQVHSFYANVFLNGMMLKRHEQSRKLLQEPKAPLSIYNPTWEKFIESYFRAASKNIQPAANTFEYNELVANMAYTLADYKKYDFEPPSTSDDELVVERILDPDLTILDSLSLIDEKGVFVYQLFNMSRFLQTQTFYSPVLLHAINELKGKHPTSIHVAKFEPKIESLKNYLKSNSVNYDKALVIETNYLRFEDLLNTLKGKNILIDIWATWCGPCIEDFNYKSRIRPFIESGEIIVLYVSIDKLTAEKKWRENMKFNQLEGYHVLANEALIHDMWQYLKGMQGSIPRYALIDKEGHLFLKEASRPSQGSKLVGEIETLLTKK